MPPHRGWQRHCQKVPPCQRRQLRAGGAACGAHRHHLAQLLIERGHLVGRRHHAPAASRHGQLGTTLPSCQPPIHGRLEGCTGARAQAQVPASNRKQRTAVTPASAVCTLAPGARRSAPHSALDSPRLAVQSPLVSAMAGRLRHVPLATLCPVWHPRHVKSNP